MGEVKRFFLCTTNITGCKIFGGIQAVLNAIYLVLVIYGFALANDQFDQVHQQLRDAGLYRHKFHQELAELSNTSNTLLIITMHSGTKIENLSDFWKKIGIFFSHPNLKLGHVRMT